MARHSKKKHEQKRRASKPQHATAATPISGKRPFVGYKPMKASRNATPYAAHAGAEAGGLPPKVDLRPMMPPVLDQGDTSSCVANATAGSYDYWVTRATNKPYDVSRLFVYYNARWSAGDQDKDDGSVIQLAMEGLKKFGACSERSWPFDKRILKRKPNRSAYQEASAARIKEMAHVETTLDAWRHALAHGYPIVFGCVLFDSFDDCTKRGGVVPMPNPEELTRAEHGGHSMCCVGYSDSEKVFIVRNSWGSEWGDKGYCYMPYAYLMNAKFNDGDSWVFVPETPLAAPQAAWLHDDTPVTNNGEGVGFEINPYSDDAYDGIDFSPLIAWALDWFDDRPAELEQYSGLVQDERFDELDHFEIDDAMADGDVELQADGDVEEVVEDEDEAVEAGAEDEAAVEDEAEDEEGVESDDDDSASDESDADEDESDADEDESDADEDESDADADESDADEDESDADEDESDADEDEGDADEDEGDADEDESDADEDESDADEDEDESDADEDESDADEDDGDEDEDEDESDADEDESDADEDESDEDEDDGDEDEEDGDEDEEDGDDEK